MNKIADGPNNTNETSSAAARPWPVTLLGLLLLLQAIGLLLLGLYTLILPENLLLAAREEPAALAGLVFIFLTPLGLLTSIGFLRRRRNAWLNAMLLQGLSLMLALAHYFAYDKPGYAYGLMAYCVVIVIYLNHYEVQEAFRAQDPTVEEEGAWEA